MRRLLVVWGAILCLSMVARAQDATAVLDTVAPESATATAAPAALHPANREMWQLGIGYQYQHYKFLGQTFHNNGYNVDITRYFNDWIGLEGTAAFGFAGNTGAPLRLKAKSLFVGGGPHIAVHNNSRVEPWFHTLVGLQHFRFTQSNNTLGLGSNNAFGVMAGGGIDLKLGTRAYWRVQGDYIGVHYRSVMTTSYSFGSGIVFNF